MTKRHISITVWVGDNQETEVRMQILTSDLDFDIDRFMISRNIDKWTVNLDVIA